MLDEKIKCINSQLDLLRDKEAVVADQYNALKKQNKNNVNSKDLNKDSNPNYPFSTYEKCFIARALLFSRSILPTISIRLECDGVRHGPFRALLDSGAQPNLISHTLFKTLKCISSQATRTVLGVASSPLTIRRKMNVVIRPWFESDAFEDDFMWIMPHDNSWRPILPSQELKVDRKDHAFRQTLADPDYYLPKEVHILLGIRFLAKILDRKVGVEPDGTTVFGTPFGNVIMGEHFEDWYESENGKVATVMDESMNEKLKGMIERLWKCDGLELEESEDGKGIGREPIWTKEERMVEEYFMNTHYRKRNGRFVVKIPFKPGVETVGSSRSIALRRFKCLEKKFVKSPQIKEFYVNEMRGLISKRHMKEVNRPPAVGKICYYIPHHYVEAKPRVVYDASCLTNTGKSLNSEQMLGPKLQADLHTTLMRFRRHKVAFCADIQKMYNQVELHEDQHDCQRIFWRENESDELKEYWIRVVTFGLASSPYLAVRCLVQTAREAQEEYPEAAKVIEKDFYMDDCASGADSVAKAVKKGKEVEKVLAGAGFRLTKYKSNKRAVLDAMNGDNSGTEEHMVFAEEGQTSILGLKWMFGKDVYTFVVKTPCLTSPLTKRKIVSCVSQLYDPNGYIAATIVIGKLIIQRCWQAKLDWDETVNSEIEKMWTEFWREIKCLENFRIERWIGTSEGSKTRLIGFSDSSTSAYGAVVYARTEYSDGTVRCRLLMSKSRVAPLKPMTIPRLELAAAELLSRLIPEIKESMEFPDMKYMLFTDSSPTLYWIRKDPAKLKMYVSNRVKLIQRRTDLTCWRYVNTKHNPADLLSRGVNPSKLVDNKLWLYGPEWLSRPVSEWPTEQFPLKLPDHTETELKVCTILEVRSELVIGPVVKGQKEMPVLDYAHNLERALRIVGFVIRAMNAIHNKHRRQKRNTRSTNSIPHPPTEKEKAWAMEYFIRKAQQQFFRADYAALRKGQCLPAKSRLEPLKPILDDRGIMRLGGRLDKSHLDYEMKHPPIIPGASRLATLIMEQAHRRCYHGGIQVVTQFIRQRYWIPRIRDELKRFTRTCLVCVRFKPVYQEQLMGILPSERTVPGKPFLNSGVDYAGPLKFKYVDKNGQTISEHKGWIAVFVCFKTRGVHLELVRDLTSASFLNCFRKFIGRRGRCTHMFSDNGTSFVGAEKEIARAYALWRKDGTLDKIAMEGTDWTFMTPAAPHQGGIYEAAVKSMKFHLRRIIGARMMEHEQLTTLLTDVEAILNSRPLTPLSDDPGDMQALTPAHFWNMEPLILPPSFRYTNDGDATGKKLWIERTRIVGHFWKRWENEYLTTLQERKKWRRERENVKVGQLVILKDENLPPAQWRIGRIQEIMPGKDGRVRNVVIKTENSTFKRPIQKLCILPIDSAEK